MKPIDDDTDEDTCSNAAANGYIEQYAQKTGVLGMFLGRLECLKYGMDLFTKMVSSTV